MLAVIGSLITALNFMGTYAEGGGVFALVLAVGWFAATVAMCVVGKENFARWW